MKAELRQGENFVLFSDFRHYAQDEAMGNLYNTAFSVQVRSGMFSGAGRWMCDRSALITFAEEMADLYAFRRESVRLDDLEYGSYMELTMDKTGHLRAAGTVYGSAMEQVLQYHFAADQTVLREFLASWQKLVLAL